MPTPQSSRRNFRLICFRCLHREQSRRAGAFRKLASCLTLASFLAFSTLSTGQAVRIAGIRHSSPRPELLTLILTVSASPSSVNFTLISGGVAVATSTIAVTTSCVLSLGLPTQFTLYGYFASASAALSGGSPVSNIPTSAVFGKDPTGSPTSFTAFTQSGVFGAAGSSLLLWSSTNNLCLLSSRTDNISLEIDLTSIPQLPAATYTGTLYLQMQAL